MLFKLRKDKNKKKGILMMAKSEEGRGLDPKKMCFVFYFFIQSNNLCFLQKHQKKKKKKKKKKGSDLILKSVFFFLTVTLGGLQKLTE